MMGDIHQPIRVSVALDGSSLYFSMFPELIVVFFCLIFFMHWLYFPFVIFIFSCACNDLYYINIIILVLVLSFLDSGAHDMLPFDSIRTYPCPENPLSKHFHPVKLAIVTYGNGVLAALQVHLRD